MTLSERKPIKRLTNVRSLFRHFVSFHEPEINQVLGQQKNLFYGIGHIPGLPMLEIPIDAFVRRGAPSNTKGGFQAGTFT